MPNALVTSDVPFRPELLVIERDTNWSDLPSAVGRLVKSRTLQQLHIKTVKIGEFPSNALVGPPNALTVYFRSPALGGRCYPISEIHARHFASQVDEAIRILQNLAATEIELSASEGWGREMLSELDLSIPIGTMPPGSGEVRVHQKTGADVLISQRLRPRHAPRPIKGAFWLNHHPEWRSIVDGVLNHGLTECELIISQSNDFGVNAKFQAKIRGAGLSLGGELKEYSKTRWVIRARFKPRGFKSRMTEILMRISSWLKIGSTSLPDI